MTTIEFIFSVTALFLLAIIGWRLGTIKHTLDKIGIAITAHSVLQEMLARGVKPKDTSVAASLPASRKLFEGP